MEKNQERCCKTTRPMTQNVSWQFVDGRELGCAPCKGILKALID